MNEERQKKPQKPGKAGQVTELDGTHLKQLLLNFTKPTRQHEPISV